MSVTAVAAVETQKSDDWETDWEVMGDGYLPIIWKIMLITV